MANLQKSQIADLAKVGITGCKTTEEATTKMLKLLEQHQVTGVEDEPFENLLMYCQAFAGEDGSAKPSTDDENDALAREVEDEDGEINRAADDDEEEELLPPVKKTAPAAKAPVKPAAPVKAAPKPAPAPAAKKAAAPPAKPGPRVPAANTSIKFDGRNDETHPAYLAFLHDFFPEAEVQYDMLKQGVTLRALMENTRPTVLNFDEVRINPDGTLSGNVYFNKFRSVEDLLAFLPAGFEDDHKIGMFRGESHPSVKALTQAQIIEIFTDTEVVAETLRRVGKLDAKLGANRAKMQETLKSAEQKKAAAPPAKPAAKK